MILPEHIKIGFEVYSVAVGSGIEGEGECHPEKGSILVKSGMSDRRYASTIIHEVLHACWDQAELPEGDADLAGLKEEDVIARLSNILTAALLDSSQLRQMLERVAGAANGTCWKKELRISSVNFEAATVEKEQADIRQWAAEQGVPVSDLDLTPERIEKANKGWADNEPRSVDYCVVCGRTTPCGKRYYCHHPMV